MALETMDNLISFEQKYRAHGMTDLNHSCDKPMVLWSLFFSYQDMTGLGIQELRAGQPDNVYVTGGPGCSIGYEHAVKQAQEIFQKICPEEEFLPPAPNPEDIDYGPSSDNPGHGSKAGFEEAVAEKGPSGKEEAKNRELCSDVKTEEGKDAKEKGTEIDEATNRPEDSNLTAAKDEDKMTKDEEELCNK